MSTSRTMEFTKEIGEGLLLVNGTHPLGVGVTSTIILTSKRAVVFDSLCYPDETRRLVEIVRREERDLTLLVNTHWHLDHVAGNQYFNTKVLSHAKCPDLMKTLLPAQLDDAKELGFDIKPKYPDQTFDGQLRLEMEDRGLTLLHLPGHTPDSIGGYLEKERILVAGDAVMDLPFIGYGDSGQAIASLRAILEMNPGVIIQGHGGVCEKGKLREDVEYLEKTRKMVEEHVSEGSSLDEILQLPMEDLLSSSRRENLHVAYKEVVHKENLRKIYEELAS